MSRRLIPVADAAVGEPRPITGAGVSVAVDTLARVLWGEAREEPVRGIEAVAAVVVNRARLVCRNAEAEWNAAVAAVCRSPDLFSCWNEDNPSLPKIFTVTEADPVFATCLRVARRAMAGVLPDPTFRATRYHGIGQNPTWADGRIPSAEIGLRLFYNNLE